MAGGGSKKTSNDSCYAFLTEDIVIEILLRLPSGSSIGRFRCVCRSWRKLLSDPDFVRRILFFQNPDKEETLRVLIMGICRGKSSSSSSHPSCAFHYSSQSHYSSRSYGTLRPVSGSSPHDSPFMPRSIYDYEDSTIVGCCGGIFCVLQGSRRDTTSEIVLWNPATSEIKTLPPYPPRRRRLTPPNPLTYKLTGFGFDPRTNDYKVIRALQFRTGGEGIVDLPARIYWDHGEMFVPAEVYSLRNNSWKKLRVPGDNSFGSRYEYDVSTSFNVNQQRDTSRNEKCYWFCNSGSYSYSASCHLISFDMTTEQFALARVLRPHGRENWYAKSCFVSKGVFMATFTSGNFNSKGNCPAPCEIWGLLKYGVAESWTKLLTVRPPGEGLYRCLEVWKDGIYICADGRWMNGTHRMFGFDPAAGEIIDDHLEIEGTIRRFQAHTYLPTQVSLKLAADLSN